MIECPKCLEHFASPSSFVRHSSACKQARGQSNFRATETDPNTKSLGKWQGGLRVSTQFTSVTANRACTIIIRNISPQVSLTEVPTNTARSKTESTAVSTIYGTTSSSQLQTINESTNWRNTVINPQHLNFQCDSTISLLLLLYSLGCSKIPDCILFCGLSPQKRWNGSGNIHETTLLEAGLNQQCALLFSARIKLEQAIKSCVEYSMIIPNKLEDGSIAYSLADELQNQIPRFFEHKELILQGLIFTTHIYPWEETLHDSFHDVGKLLLPYLKRFWEYVLGETCANLPAHARESLVEASLAASRLIGVSSANCAISVAAKMWEAGLPDYLLLAIVNRQSVMLRFKGDHDQSDFLIQDILNRIATADIRSHCLYGRLLLSRAENAILRKEFDKAASYLGQWEAKNDPPSGCELQVIRLKNTVFGRVSRYQGDFLHAQYCLNACLVTIRTETSRYHVMHHLADVYCELGLVGNAEELLTEVVEDLKVRGEQHSKPFRRLLLPLAEAYIEQRRFKEARAALLQLGDIFDGIAVHNVSDQLDHVRSILGLVRIAYCESRWFEALRSSEKALFLVQKYKTFSGGNFYKGVILLFRTVIYSELGRLQESQTAFALAKLCDQGPRYFIPGMGTYVLQALRSRIESLQ